MQKPKILTSSLLEPADTSALKFQRAIAGTLSLAKPQAAQLRDS
jgi:hypothetical protein